MLTGTPLDLTPFGPALQGVGLVFVLLALGALYWAVRKPRTVAGKVICSAIVVAVFGYFPAKAVWEGHKHRQRVNEAFARFQEHCRSAGPKIKRVVEDVDGIAWLKWRPGELNLYDQYRLNDPYGHDCDGEACIKQLLRATEGLENDPARKQPHTKGYRYVETIDPRDGRAYRYSLALVPKSPAVTTWRTQLRRIEIAQPIAPYGVTWDDLSTREDRDRWIAGSSLKVIDLHTNEVIAERIGYMFDAGLGASGDGRQPWTYAQRYACPEFPAQPDARRIRSLRETPNFLLTVLKPRLGVRS